MSARLSGNSDPASGFLPGSGSWRAHLQQELEASSAQLQEFGAPVAPTAPPDTVRYDLCFRASSSETARAFAQELSRAGDQLVSSLLPGYLWYDQGFRLDPVSGLAELELPAPQTANSPKAQPAAAPRLWRLRGETRFGDCVDDEWLCAWLVLQLSRRFGGRLAAQVVDADGQFLLVEAAGLLPDWVEPGNSEHRLFLVSGGLRLLPRKQFPNPSQADGVRWLLSQDASAPTSASSSSADGIQSSRPSATARPADVRISAMYTGRDPGVSASPPPASGTPELDRRLTQFLARGERWAGLPESAMATNIHRTRIIVPFTTAEVLLRLPGILPHACRVFLQRQPADLRAVRLGGAGTSSSVPTASSGGAAGVPATVEYVCMRVRFQRLQFAQLLAQSWQAPVGSFPLPRELALLPTAGHPIRQAFDLGVKVACGLEMLRARLPKPTPVSAAISGKVSSTKNSTSTPVAASSSPPPPLPTRNGAPNERAVFRFTDLLRQEQLKQQQQSSRVRPSADGGPLISFVDGDEGDQDHPAGDDEEGVVEHKSKGSDAADNSPPQFVSSENRPQQQQQQEQPDLLDSACFDEYAWQLYRARLEVLGFFLEDPDGRKEQQARAHFATTLREQQLKKQQPQQQHQQQSSMALSNTSPGRVFQSSLLASPAAPAVQLRTPGLTTLGHNHSEGCSAGVVAVDAGSDSVFLGFDSPSEEAHALQRWIAEEPQQLRRTLDQIQAATSSPTVQSESSVKPSSPPSSGKTLDHQFYGLPADDSTDWMEVEPNQLQQLLEQFGMAVDESDEKAGGNGGDHNKHTSASSNKGNTQNHPNSIPAAAGGLLGNELMAPGSDDDADGDGSDGADDADGAAVQRLRQLVGQLRTLLRAESDFSGVEPVVGADAGGKKQTKKETRKASNNSILPSPSSASSQPAILVKPKQRRQKSSPPEDPSHLQQQSSVDTSPPSPSAKELHTPAEEAGVSDGVADAAAASEQTPRLTSSNFRHLEDEVQEAQDEDEDEEDPDDEAPVQIDMELVSRILAGDYLDEDDDGDGAAENVDFLAEDGDAGGDENSLRHYMRAMDLELATRQPGDGSGQQKLQATPTTGDGAGDEGEHDDLEADLRRLRLDGTREDLDLNLVRQLLESFGAQAGGAGPASSLLNSLEDLL